MAARRRAGQPRRMGADRGAQPRPRPIASRVGAPGKGISGRGRQHPGANRGGRSPGPRRRAADDVHLRASGSGSIVTAGADAAAGVRAYRRRDRPRATADGNGCRTTDYPGEGQSPARQHPAAGATGRVVARAHTACAQLHLFGVHRGLLVDGGAVGDPRRVVRRRSPAGLRAVHADADRVGSSRAGSPCAAA